VKNAYLRAFCCGALLLGLTTLIGNGDYNGAGMGIINNALSGKAVPWAFALKILFTD
jgi:hypothetical protein